MRAKGRLQVGSHCDLLGLGLSGNSHWSQGGSSHKLSSLRLARIVCHVLNKFKVCLVKPHQEKLKGPKAG